jgi:hypothetical protein
MPGRSAQPQSKIGTGCSVGELTTGGLADDSKIFRASPSCGTQVARRIERIESVEGEPNLLTHS